MTAPKGFYTTVYGSEVNGISEESVYVSLNTLPASELEGIGQVYPNPANKLAQISFSKELSADVNIKLVNAKGQVILFDKAKKGDTNLKIDVSKLKSGIYWLIFNSENGSTARKIVVNR